MRDERPPKDLGPDDERPPRRGNYRLESPFYEEEFDPYFSEQVEAPRAEDDPEMSNADDDLYWSQPDDYWLEEGMWPWPESNSRRRGESPPPADPKRP